MMRSFWKIYKLVIPGIRSDTTTKSTDNMEILWQHYASKFYN